MLVFSIAHRSKSLGSYSARDMNLTNGGPPPVTASFASVLGATLNPRAWRYSEAADRDKYDVVDGLDMGTPLTGYLRRLLIFLHRHICKNVCRMALDVACSLVRCKLHLLPQVPQTENNPVLGVSQLA